MNTNLRCFSLDHDRGNLFIMEMYEDSNRPSPEADWMCVLGNSTAISMTVCNTFFGIKIKSNLISLCKLYYYKTILVCRVSNKPNVVEGRNLRKL